MHSSAALDAVWVIATAALVFVMQAGFACLESGMVRSKNAVNVAAKNVIDFCVSALVFWAFGYGLMFGSSLLGIAGTDRFLFGGGEGSGLNYAFFLFQLMFCGTATTIVSGAVAERMSFIGYILTATVLSAVIYPVTGHWAWNGADKGTLDGWLASLGFVDFAGSTVVHSIGGWVALVALIIMGPRLGRYGQNGRPILGHDLTLATLGTFLLWFGWIGFNGGSTLAVTSAVAPIIVHTMLAGAAGGLAGIFVSSVHASYLKIENLLNGVLGGLVAITANCHVVGTFSALIVGAVGGIIGVTGVWLLDKWKIDDAVGAVPVHLFAGVWGTIAVALFGDPELIGTGLGFWEQLGVQVLGVSAIGAYAFAVSFAVLKSINYLVKLRVSPEDELHGLNVTEHGAYNAVQQLIGEMEVHRVEGRIGRPVTIEPGSDVAPIAEQYNRVVTRIQEDSEQLTGMIADLQRAKSEAESASRAKSAFLANMSHELRTPLNAVIGFSEMMTREMFGPIENEKYKDYAKEIYHSGEHLLSLVNDVLDQSRIEAGQMELQESAVDLAQLIASAVQNIELRATNSGLTLQSEVQSSLPMIIADQRAVRQILLNLLSNAVKFTARGGRIRVSARIEHDGRMAITVEDSGIGMHKADIPRALQPFVQLHDASYGNARKGQAGTGLGLPLVNALTRLHNGTLTIDSAPGVGTAITVRFPGERTLRPEVAA